MAEHTVLYRKYRPTTFKDVVGQEHVVTTLKNALKDGRVAHAYLFSGPRGTGKTTIARLLAKELNKGADDSSLDLIEIDAASNRGVDEIRALREGVRVGPTQGKYKIYLVDEAHMLTKEAFNAFLKTLEEPPPFVVFVLATTEPHKLPETIISRTQRFDFRRLTLAEIIRRLTYLLKEEGVGAEKGVLQIIASEADGSMRDAESLLGQIMTLGASDTISVPEVEDILGLFSHTRVGEFVDMLIKKEREGALDWIQKVVDEGHDLSQFLKSLQRYLRHLLFVDMGEKLAEKIKEHVDEESFNVLKEQAGRTSPGEIKKWLQAFSKAGRELNSYPLQQMALEVTLIELLE